MKKVVVSAPGKLMLLGEHAVVYNHPCLVTAVDQRMKLTAQALDEKILQLEAENVGVVGYQKSLSELGQGEIPKGAKFVEIALLNFSKKYPLETGVKITTKSQFSSLFGFGSSSASTVCLLKAVSELFGKKLSNKQIFDLSFKTVLDIQGTGSGFDVAAATFGGTLYFVTGGKKVQQLNLADLPIRVGYSGSKGDTVTMIKKVTERFKKYPKLIDEIYQQIEVIVKLAKKALLKKDWEELGKLMDINQGLLESIGVSTMQLAKMNYAAREAGAMGAKLSGGGGGDCMLVLAPTYVKQIIKAIEKVDGKFMDVKLNAEGVRVETT